ncbi:lytic transglycosylase domain-containing protein [Cupriavidus basilensis]
MVRGAILLISLCCAGSAFATCWESVSAKYGLPVPLLKAIAAQESSFDNGAVNVNKDGSRDVCMMQINSTWFPKLQRDFHISEHELRTDPCTCLDVGAWILTDNVKRLGPTWDAVGAYNAASRDKRQSYAWKIHRRLASPSPAKNPEEN